LISIVDNDFEGVSLLADALARVGYRVETFERGEDALLAAEHEPPDLVLVDTKLPGMSGYAVCREFKDRLGTAIPVFFVSADRTESSDRVAGFLVGADDYLVKPFDPDEVVARVRRFVSPVARTTRSAQDWNLTKREREVLDLLAEGRTEQEIAEQLFITPKTVATHIQRVLRKLEVHSRTQAVALVHTTALSESRR
jgi:DNA-binding NarL/FixJ family response regulator